MVVEKMGVLLEAKRRGKVGQVGFGSQGRGNIGENGVR